jgi:CubicO group peptidase (beta-lactamase class C family)
MKSAKAATAAKVAGIVMLASAVATGAFADPPLPAATPESQGFSSERLERLHARLKGFVDEGKYSGMVLLLARNGRIVDWQTYGLRDVEERLPMEKDTIVRLYSMSKIVTSVAALILHEEGRLKLDDPVSKYLPALEKPKVMTGGTVKAPVLVAAKTPITVKHLLTHTAGFLYGFGTEPIDKIYQQAGLWEAASMDEFVAKAAKLPLGHEPGTRFRYGINTDLLGAVIEKVSGQTLDAFVEERICKPLGLADTGYDVPAEKMGRLAKVYTLKEGHFSAVEPAASSFAEKGRGFPTGGAGMFSTAGDYARFAQMLLNGGELDGVRILGRKTVELMTVNHLNGLKRVTNEFSESDGFGLGVYVRLDLAKSNRLGSEGTFGWSGAATTNVIMDPREKLVAIVLAQHMPFNQNDLFWYVSTLTYQSLTSAP